MTSLFAQFETDQELEQGGIVLDYGKNKHGKPIEIRIARAGGSNTKFSKVAEFLLKPHRRSIANETIDNDVLDAVFREIYAKAVVIGWTGVLDKDGTELAFTEANVIDLFKQMPDLFADIRQSAEKMRLFQRLELEDDAKN